LITLESASFMIWQLPCPTSLPSNTNLQWDGLSLNLYSSIEQIVDGKKVGVQLIKVVYASLFQRIAIQQTETKYLEERNRHILSFQLDAVGN